MNDINSLLGEVSMTVSEAMQSIDKNSCGILFLIDEQRKMAGCITDGDIRRFLLAGGKMTDSVMKAANTTPRYAKSTEEARVLYHRKNFVVIPVIDDNGVIIDMYNGEAGFQRKVLSALHIPVVINAGGKGTRLDPFTRVLPKPLIPVGDIPIIEHIIKEFKLYGCDEFHIIVNYKKELMKAYFADSGDQYHITWYDESKPLGTGGGLSMLRGKLSETFFFVNCDSLLKANYESMIKFHKKNKNAITMVCAYKNINIPYGVVEMGLNGSIESMKEKPQITFLTNTGCYIVEADIIEDIEVDVAVGFPDIVEREKDKGRKVAVFPVNESQWMDMGQLPELEKMRLKLYSV